MAKHQITINIVSKQSKDEEKREKLDNAIGKSDNSGTNPSDNLRKKKANKSGESSSSKKKSSSGEGGKTTGGGSTGNSSSSSSSSKNSSGGKAAAAIDGATKLIHTTASTAINLTGSVGDYTVEAARIKSVQKLGDKVSSIAINSAASGPAWWVTLIFELANWGVEMAENNIQWNHQQQMNTIQAERASNRLGIVATAGNRNMKL